jgi:hypothetical protein
MRMRPNAILSGWYLRLVLCAEFDPAAGKMVNALWQLEIDAEERG